ncbi:MAG: hypothetical protein MJ249_01680 [Kiritimatiellae bacterium]|nr:hypothetical protein [Kiritimatiellia bacterium]
MKACGVDCLDICAFTLSGDFPLAVATRYDAVQLMLLGEMTIAFEPRREVLPDEIIAAYRQISGFRRAVVVLEFADREYSECLRKAKVNYIVPGRQIFMPPHAVLTPPEAYDRFEKPFLRKFLSPWAQVVFFRMLLFHAGEESVSYATLREELSIKDVYLTRACQELEYHRLATMGKTGRNRFVSLPKDRRLLWRSAEKCLRTPIVKSVRFTGKMDGGLLSGYSALARVSDLLTEDETSFAMSIDQVRKLDESKIQKYSGVPIEIWRYAPVLLAQDGRVDSLSLYMALKDSPDARVQIALSDLLERTL